MNKKNQREAQENMPSAEEVAHELSKATSIDDCVLISKNLPF